VVAQGSGLIIGQAQEATSAALACNLSGVIGGGQHACIQEQGAHMTVLDGLPPRPKILTVHQTWGMRGTPTPGREIAAMVEARLTVTAQ